MSSYFGARSQLYSGTGRARAGAGRDRGSGALTAPRASPALEPLLRQPKGFLTWQRPLLRPPGARTRLGRGRSTFGDSGRADRCPEPQRLHSPHPAAERARRGHRQSVQRTRARVGNTSRLPRERREGGRARRAPAARLRREPSRPPPAGSGASVDAEARPEVVACREWGRSRITPAARRAVRGAGQQVRRKATADGSGPESANGGYSRVRYRGRHILVLLR